MSSSSAVFASKEQSRNHLRQCGRKLGGLPDLEEHNAKVVVDKGSQAIHNLTQLRIVEQNRRGCKHVSDPHSVEWANMKNHWNRVVVRADMVVFKTRLLYEICNTPSLHPEVFSAFHLHRCARDSQHYPIAAQKLQLFRWAQNYSYAVYFVRVEAGQATC